MAPANSKPQLKQKTLLGFFAKTNVSTSSPSKPTDTQPKVEAKPKDEESAKASSDKPNALKKDINTSNVQEKSSYHDSSVGRSSKRASSPLHGVKETPPTSDPIDVDMLSDAEDETKVVDPPVRVLSARCKSRILTTSANRGNAKRPC